MGIEEVSVLTWADQCKVKGISLVLSSKKEATHSLAHEASGAINHIKK